MLQSRHAHVGVQRRVRCRRLVAIAEIKKLHLIIKCKVICYNEHLESPWTRRKNVEFDGHRNLLEAALGRTVRYYEVKPERRRRIQRCALIFRLNITFRCYAETYTYVTPDPLFRIPHTSAAGIGLNRRVRKSCLRRNGYLARSLVR